MGVGGKPGLASLLIFLGVHESKFKNRRVSYGNKVQLTNFQLTNWPAMSTYCRTLTDEEATTESTSDLLPAHKQRSGSRESLQKINAQKSLPKIATCKPQMIHMQPRQTRQAIGSWLILFVPGAARFGPDVQTCSFAALRRKVHSDHPAAMRCISWLFRQDSQTEEPEANFDHPRSVIVRELQGFCRVIWCGFPWIFVHTDRHLRQKSDRRSWLSQGPQNISGESLFSSEKPKGLLHIALCS